MVSSILEPRGDCKYSIYIYISISCIYTVYSVIIVYTVYTIHFVYISYDICPAEGHPGIQLPTGIRWPLRWSHLFCHVSRGKGRFVIFLLPAPAQDMPAESMCADVMSSCTGPLDLHGFKALTTPTYFQLLRPPRPRRLARSRRVVVSSRRMGPFL